MTYNPPLNPKAVNPQDKWLVINTAHNRVAESWATQGSASRACHVLNNHEIRNGRKPCFVVKEKEDGNS